MAAKQVSRIGQRGLADQPRIDLPLPIDFRMPVCQDQTYDWIIQRVVNPHPADRQAHGRITATVKNMARIELYELEPMAAPGSEDLVCTWLWPIADAVEWTPSEAEFFRRARAVWFAACEVPHVAWTRQKQMQGMRLWPKFPSVSAVYDLVYPPVRPLVFRVRALRRIVNE